MATIWAIGDLHFSFGTPGKEMDIFGQEWHKHYEKIATSWDASVSPEDLVLIPGDISWAMTLEEAMPDLEWIHKRPGTKVMIRGNHDYWWNSISKVRKVLPSSVHVIWNDAFLWNDVAVAGTRLWDNPEYSFTPYVNHKGERKEVSQEDEKIFQRELGRLKMSLAAMSPQAKHKIVMTHYPPIGADLKESCVSKMLEEAQVPLCIFGHLHSMKKDIVLFGKKNGVEYHLVSCDFLNFQLFKLME